METTVKHLTTDELEAALDHLREAPKDEGVLQLIVSTRSGPTASSGYG